MTLEGDDEKEIETPASDAESKVIVDYAIDTVDDAIKDICKFP